MTDFVDFNNATFDGGDGGGVDMLFDDIFGVGGSANANQSEGQGAGSFVPPPIERQAVIFLIDCSISMFAPQYDPTTTAGTTTTAGGSSATTTFYHTPFSKAVKFARDFCQQKVFTAEKDLTAVVLYNSKKPLNQYNFPSIFVFQEFNSPSAPQVQELDTLSRAGIFVQIADANGVASGNTAASLAARFNENTYAEFKEMIGHADALEELGGAPSQEQQAPILVNPITGQPVQRNANNSGRGAGGGSTQNRAAALSEVLWTCQHLFHFLKNNSHSNYVFTKHIMVFTDKEDPVVSYVAARGGPTLRGVPNSNNNGGLETLKRVLLEYERSESRIRDLHEDGVTVEVFGYTEKPGKNTTTTTTTTEAKKEEEKKKKRAGQLIFNAKAFWAKFLNAPTGECEPLSEEVRRVLRGGGGASASAASSPFGAAMPQGAGGSGSGGGGGGGNSNNMSNSYSASVPVSGMAAFPAVAAPPQQQLTATPPPQQPIDWFSTLAPPINSASKSNSNASSSSNNGTYDGIGNGSSATGGLHGGSSADPNASAFDDLQNLPKGTVKVALGRVYPLPRPGPEGKEKQSLHRQLDANLAGTADEQEELEQALMAESMMMKTAYVRQHATRSVGSLLVTFGANASSATSVDGTTPTFAVKVYRPIVPMAKPRFSWRHSRTNEVLVTKTKYIDSTTGVEVVDTTGTAASASASPAVAAALPNTSTAIGGNATNSLVYYAEVAGDRACFSASERQQIKAGTFRHLGLSVPSSNLQDEASPPGIRVIGFRNFADVYKPKYSLNRAVFIHPYTDASSSTSSSSSAASSSSIAKDPSVRFFVGLHRTLTNRKMVAIAEMVSRRSGAPAMVMLIPSTLPSLPPNPIQQPGTSTDPLGLMAASSTSPTPPGYHYPHPHIDLSPYAATPPNLYNTSSSANGQQGSSSMGTNSLNSGVTSHGIPAGYLQGALAVDGCGFHVVSLPYADDIRSMTAFKRFNTQSPANPSDELVTKAKKIIRKLTVTYMPDAITNPTLAHQYRQLQRLALGNDELDDGDASLLDTDDDDDGNTANAALAAALANPHEELRRKRRRIQDAFDVTLPHKEGMNHFKSLYEDFNKSAFPQGYSAEIWAPTPKAKAPGPTKDDLENIDWDGLCAAGKIGTLTMVPLQAYLKLHGAPSSGKKNELVDRVKGIIASKQSAAAGATAAQGANGHFLLKAEMPTQ